MQVFRYNKWSDKQPDKQTEPHCPGGGDLHHKSGSESLWTWAVYQEDEADHYGLWDKHAICLIESNGYLLVRIRNRLQFETKRLKASYK